MDNYSISDLLELVKKEILQEVELILSRMEEHEYTQDYKAYLKLYQILDNRELILNINSYEDEEDFFKTLEDILETFSDEFSEKILLVDFRYEEFLHWSYLYRHLIDFCKNLNTTLKDNKYENLFMILWDIIEESLKDYLWVAQELYSNQQDNFENLLKKFKEIVKEFEGIKYLKNCMYNYADYIEDIEGIEDIKDERDIRYIKFMRKDYINKFLLDYRDCIGIIMKLDWIFNSLNSIIITQNCI